MTRDRKDLGARKHVRVDLRKPGFVIPAPDAPWIECQVVDISENGASLDVGDLAVPKLFGLSLTAGRGTVRRLFRFRQGDGAGPSAFDQNQVGGPEASGLILRSLIQRLGHQPNS